MTRKVVSAAAILVLLSLAFVPAMEAAPPSPQFLFQDICSNGVGWSVPGPAGGDPTCGTTVDCCAMFQTAHVHDLGQVFKPKKLIVLYTPGLYAGCEDTMTVSVSKDAVTWTVVKTATVISAPSGGGWETYAMTLNVAQRIRFRYVQIQIPACFNDLSEAIVIF